MNARLGVLSRTLAAAAGGYALASLVAAASAVALPGPRADAVLAGMMLGLLAQLAAALWAFAARSPARAWLGLLLPGAAVSAVLLIHTSAAP